ncbi:MAG: DinB family protein [Chitinophagales bacterium]|nr:DinB family protein [Chitinophagales bacterium]
MQYTKQIAKHLNEVYNGGNWTWVNLHDTLKDVTWQQATTKVQDMNTIAVITFHMGYYVAAILNVLRGNPLDSKDELSFNHPPINSEADWQAMCNTISDNWQALVVAIEQLPDEKLEEYFTQEKYGIYYRNLHGLIEHTHYHMGQIVIIKKLLKAEEK